jgi:hypothetical protein
MHNNVHCKQLICMCLLPKDWYTHNNSEYTYLLWVAEKFWCHSSYVSFVGCQLFSLLYVTCYLLLIYLVGFFFARKCLRRIFVSPSFQIIRLETCCSTFVQVCVYGLSCVHVCSRHVCESYTACHEKIKKCVPWKSILFECHHIEHIKQRRLDYCLKNS